MLSPDHNQVDFDFERFILFEPIQNLTVRFAWDVAGDQLFFETKTIGSLASKSTFIFLFCKPPSSPKDVKGVSLALFSISAMSLIITANPIMVCLIFLTVMPSIQPPTPLTLPRFLPTKLS